MSKFQSYNANPIHNRTGDCVIRALSKVLSMPWEKVYLELAIQGYLMCDIMSSNGVWGTYLRGKGFERELIPTDNIDYTVERFCNEQPKGDGKYLLAISGHVVACEIKNGIGTYFDSWNSGDEIVVYYWYKKER